MTAYLLRKFTHLVLVLFLVTLGVAGLISLIPGDPALTILGNTATPDQIKVVDNELGLGGSFFSRYWHWLDHALHGNLGSSVITRQPVLDAIKAGLPVTLEIVVLGLLIALVVSIPLAAYTSRHAGGTIDTLTTGISSVLLTVPAYISGVVLLYLLAVLVPVFPVGGWVPLTSDPLQNLRAAALPAIVIGAGPLAGFYRILRTDLITTLEQDFVLAARAKGLPTRYIMMRHVMRPSMITLLTTAGLTIGGLIGGTVIVEVIFQAPGIGFSVVQAILTKDVAIVQGITMLIAVIYVLVNALVDIMYAVVDPRVKRA